MRRAWQKFATNRGALLSAGWLLLIGILSFVGPIFYDVSYERIDLTQRFVQVTGAHPLGTDESGRDVLSRMLYGGRVSLMVGVIAAAVAIVVGTAIGAYAGHAGGRWDAVLMRFTDAFMAVPLFFFLLTLLAIFGSGFGLLVTGIGATSWMPVARVVRGDVLRFRQVEFIQAAETVGCTRMRILWRHLIPQAVPSVIVAATLGVANAILTETALSYLGLGVQPPLPSWGGMLTAAQNYIYTAPLLAIYPGLAIMLTVLAFNVMGDGVRDALDPYTSR